MTFSGDMSKMHYFSNKFSKNRQALVAFRPQLPFTLDFANQKLRD